MKPFITPRSLCRLGFVAAALTLATACEHKDLCFDHDVHAPKSQVQVRATYEREWQYTYGGTNWATFPTWTATYGMAYDDLRPGLPDGLRLQVHNADGSTQVENLPAAGDTVLMRPGLHSLLFYNNDTEYIVFDDLGSYASASATTRPRSRATYMGNAFMGAESENTVTMPDMLYGCYLPSFMVECRHDMRVLPIVMRPLVFTYLVRFEFTSGQEYVALARGALAGMSRAVWLHNGRTSTDEATILYDCTMQPFGAQALVRSFGIPDFPNDHYAQRGPDKMRKYGLTLEVRLKNGKLKSFDFDVTDQVSAQPQGGVIVVRGLVIPESEGVEGGSGFDVNVEGWGDYQDIELRF